MKQYRTPYVVFTRLQVDKELIIGYDYSALRTRASCYVKITSGNSVSYARVKHFCLLFGLNGPECFAGVHFLPGAERTLYSFPLVYVGDSILTYISVEFIDHKINLFPVFSVEGSSSISGYWVTPTSTSPPNAGII